MRSSLRLLGATALLTACVACGSTSPGSSGKASDSSSSGDSSSSSPSPSPSSPSSSSSSSSSSPSAAALPSCDSVWKAGATLDERYQGCTTGAGTTVLPKGTYCESGQFLISYDNRFYAPLGGRVHTSGDLAHDRAFQRQLKACTA